MTEPTSATLDLRSRIRALHDRLDASETSDAVRLGRAQLGVLEAICAELDALRPDVPSIAFPRDLEVGLTELHLTAGDRVLEHDWFRGRGVLRLDPIRSDGTIPARVLSFGIVLPPGLAGMEDTTVVRFIGLGAADDGIDPLTGRGKLSSWVWIDNAAVREVHGSELGMLVEERISGFDLATGDHRASMVFDIGAANPKLADLVGATTVQASSAKGSKNVKDDYEAFKMWFSTVAAAIIGELLPGLGEALSVAAGAQDFACAVWLSTVNRRMTNLAQAMVPDATVQQLQQYKALTQARQQLMRICDP